MKFADKKKIAIVAWLFHLTLLGSSTPLFALEEIDNGWQINELELLDSVGEARSFRRDGGDPYIIFPYLAGPECGTDAAVRFVLQFSPVIQKRFLAELFWRSATSGFSEEKKVFFFLAPPEQGNLIDITVPIPDHNGYDQIRFDLPRDLNEEFTVLKFSMVDLSHPPQDSEIIDSYRKLSRGESEDLNIVVPYLIKTIGHGCKRLTGDKPFLIFWVGIIVLILFAIRKLGKNLNELSR